MHTGVCGRKGTVMKNIKKSNIQKSEIVTNTNLAMSDICNEIAAVIRSTLTPVKMQETILSYHEKDIAMSLELLTDQELSKLFRVLSLSDIVSILEYSENSLKYFERLSIRQKVDALSEMETSSAAELLSGMPTDERKMLTELISPSVRSDISMISSFDDDEIGSRMSTNFIEIKNTCTVKEAMSELVRQAADNDNVSVIYVTDSDSKFCGAIDLNDLIIAREQTPLENIIKYSHPYVYAKEKIDSCMSSFIDYSESSIPVLDDSNKLIGVVTAQDFMEVIDDELGEDYAKLGGLTSEEDLSEPVLRSVKKRLPWLSILLIMGLGVSATVGLFESIVSQLPIIMCFQSLILDMAGNVGTQSLAVAIRVLMDKHINGRRKAALVWKELRVGLLNGMVMGILSFVCIGGYLCLKGHSPLFSFTVSACLGLAMVLAMLISSVSGTVIPIFFGKIGVDPAVASGPLITTVNDLVAVISYYGLAWVILIQWLHLV